jgi:drug/metabolite transporter (DMT)-like permease
MAWIFLGENLDTVDILGFLVATLGVYVATREKN